MALIPNYKSWAIRTQWLTHSLSPEFMYRWKCLDCNAARVICDLSMKLLWQSRIFCLRWSLSLVLYHATYSLESCAQWEKPMPSNVNFSGWEISALLSLHIWPLLAAQLALSSFSGHDIPTCYTCSRLCISPRHQSYQLFVNKINVCLR